MNKKQIAILAMSIVVVLAGGFSALYFGVIRERPKEPVTISMQLPWAQDSGLSYFRAEADLFEELYPWITVKLTTVPLGDLNQNWAAGWPKGAPEVAVVTDALPAESFLDGAAPFPWTGPLWALYVNTEVMSGIEGWSDGPPEHWRTGSVTLGEMESVFASLSTTKPISVGGQFGWPLAAWLQHISILVHGGDPPLAQADGSLTSEGGAALDIWRKWVEEGWVVDGWSRQDWPVAARDLAEGKAAFALMGGSLVSSFPRGSEEYITALPFPRGEGPAWTVGSLWSIAIPAAAPAPEEAGLFFQFLTSPGVSGRLSQKLKTIFYNNESTAAIAHIYTSVTNQTDSPLIAALMNPR